MITSQDMSQDFQPGDYLVFQLESGFGLLRILSIGEAEKDTIWHLAGYGELFPDVDTAEAAITDGRNLSRSQPHIALTNRAFESTQVAKIGHTPIHDDELAAYEEWKAAGGIVSDRSVRLMLGLR